MTDKLLAYMDEHGIGEDDLLFPYSLLRAEWEAAQLPADGRTLNDMPADLPRTPPNKYGKTYRHGTTGGCGPGGCRCHWCRLATPNTGDGAELIHLGRHHRNRCPPQSRVITCHRSRG